MAFFGKFVGEFDEVVVDSFGFFLNEVVGVGYDEGVSVDVGVDNGSVVVVGFFGG